MKITRLYTLILVLASLSLYGQQTNTRNYIISRTYKQSGANPDDVSKVNLKVQYIDGLGRTLQNVHVRQSRTGSDIIEPFNYDGAGRQARQYLPYDSTGKGKYYSAAISHAEDWYTNNIPGLKMETADALTRPFSETVFEKSPLSRPSTEQGPGGASRSGSVKYKVNAASEVKRYEYDPATNTITNPGYYNAGTLARKQLQDPENRENNEYTDMLGQVVCKTVLTGSETLYTYYVYDDLGLLRSVLQPNYQDDASLPNSAFLYDYDDQGRTIRKQIPGGGATEIVYDLFDRPVMSRDANQMARNVWGFTRFDVLNRPVMTGELPSSKSRTEWQNKYNAVTAHHENRQGAAGLGYTLNLTSVATADGFPQLTETNVLTITYYDDYNFPNPSGFGYVASAGYPSSANMSVKSQVTGTRARVLVGTEAAAGNWLNHVTYYDGEYRPIQEVRDLHDLGTGAFERVSTRYKYDLAPVVAQRQTIQVVGGVTHALTSDYTYDHADRLASVKETVTVGSKTKTAYTLAQRYNILGQLESKWFHAYSTNGTKYRRKTNYTNNIRGWLTDANTAYQIVEGADLPFYGFSLSYNNKLYAPQYSNGNITKMQWLGKDETAFSGALAFAYDGANRLTTSTVPTPFTNTDTESGISYDKNGNIKTLNRAGVAVDQLVYNYAGTGNRLGTLTDASSSNTGVKSGVSSYGYDANGNMTSDGNRSATLTYNHLNLPKTVTVDGKTLTYDYDAAGNKYKYVADTLIVKYAGAFEYGSDNSFRRVATASGQAVMAKVSPSPASDTIRFDYYLTDHLGNVRLVFDESGKTIQKTDYYPFGLEIDRNNPVTSMAARNGVNRYLYNGKERQTGTGYLDYGARMYDPSIGRWGVVDPLSEVSRRWSPYSYGYNNPLRFIDPDGRMAFDVRLQGQEAQEAFKQLQASVQKDLTLSMDNTGKLSYTQNGDGKLSKSAAQLTNAINDHSIVVNVNAENTTTTKSGNLYIGGAFSGNTVTKGADGNSVVAEQEVNPTVLGAMSTAHGKPGADILHEVTEAYQGGLISQKSGMSSPASNQPGSVYQKAHDRATNQSGQVFERIYDSSGRELQMTPTGYPAGVKSADWYVNDKSGNKVIIQTIK